MTLRILGTVMVVIGMFIAISYSAYVMNQPDTAMVAVDAFLSVCLLLFFIAVLVKIWDKEIQHVISKVREAFSDE